MHDDIINSLAREALLTASCQIAFKNDQLLNNLGATVWKIEKTIDIFGVFCLLSI